ncbi:MAG: hypothetical protein NC898_04530 [Candidatus Omnitrophica bacterium]|nr:hypothetical protein [Candidatus Omnitrophota bacterium]
MAANLENSAGWKFKPPKCNHLCAPDFIGPISKTRRSKHRLNKYRKGDNSMNLWYPNQWLIKKMLKEMMNQKICL